MASKPDTLIAGRFSIDPNRALQDAGGGLRAFAARDESSGNAALIGIQVDRQSPARFRALRVLSEPIDGLMAPLAHGQAPGVGGISSYYIVCTAPSGTPLTTQLRPWSEAALIEQVLRPAAHVLEQLATRGVTHRSIRLNNLFQAQRGHPVVLGAAWAAPPAQHQPAVFEPPYSAMCHPAGRGDGTIADDIYALGVLLLTLALGRLPMADLDRAAIIQRKLEQGSHAALVGDTRLPSAIADLLRGMLAEDPDHRPSPALLLDPSMGRGRRVVARPPNRAQRPLTLGSVAVWDARTLAYILATDAERGLAALRGGAVLQWLRRGLVDVSLTAKLEDVLRHRTEASADDSRVDAVVLTRVIAMLDPLAPLCWRGFALWPDAVGPMLAAQQTEPALSGPLTEMVELEVLSAWALARADRGDPTRLRHQARELRSWLSTRGPGGGLLRLTYMLNPLLPCGSALMERNWVMQFADVLAALEDIAATNPSSAPVDAHVAAFVTARAERQLDAEANALSTANANEVGLAELRLLAELQARFRPQPLPNLAAWVAGRAEPLIAGWHNRPRRTKMVERLSEVAKSGMLLPMVSLLEDRSGRQEDARGAHQAIIELAEIDSELLRIAEATDERRSTAVRVGQEIAAGIGFVALAVMLVLAVLA